MNTKPLLRYRLLIAVLSPWLLLKTAVDAIKARDLRFILQRFGYDYRVSASAKSQVWIHCASVGEVTAVRPLIDKIQKQLPGVKLLLTTTTTTSATTVDNQGWCNLQHQYLPLDFFGPVKRFFKNNQPRVLIIMETEIWPNLILYARQQQVPVVIINGRISHRTLNTPAWLKPVYHQVLPAIDAILCKSADDVSSYIELGAVSMGVKSVGNIKFAIDQHLPVTCELDRPFWLAASTHDDEERQIGNALLASQLPEQVLLVIAPRHPHRSASIQIALSDCGLRFAVRSKSELPDADTQIYIADTLGEMDRWLSAAQLVFMGGSLVPVGGHNLLEPASAGVAIVSGEYLDNVTEEASLLVAAGAMRRVATAAELIALVETLLRDKVRLASMGQAGRDVVAGKSEVVDEYFEYIVPFITEPDTPGQ